MSGLRMIPPEVRRENSDDLYHRRPSPIHKIFPHQLLEWEEGENSDNYEFFERRNLKADTTKTSGRDPHGRKITSNKERIAPEKAG